MMKNGLLKIALVCAYCTQNVKSEIIPITSKTGSNSDVMRQREELIKIWVNPCTGSISTEEKPIDQLPCLNATSMPSISKMPSSKPSKMPSKSPSAAPSISSRPSARPAPDVTVIPIIPPIIPPAPAPSPTECIKCREGNSTVVVKFNYTLETTNTTTDPKTVLPKLEETILKNLADKLLQHCLNNDGVLPPPTSRSGKGGKGGKGNTRRMGGSNRYQRRNLKVKRKLETLTVGICSAPTDKHLQSKTCVPEENKDNNCFVIEGGVTVSVDDLDTDQTIVDIIYNTTKEAMDKDELLTDENPEVEKVKMWEDNSSIPPIPPITGTSVDGSPELPVILGATFALLALLLAGGLLRNRKNFDEGITGAVKTDNSFVAPTGLDVRASCMDVHACKSAACKKCYESGQGVCFHHAPVTPRPPRAFIEDGAPVGWVEQPSMGSSSFESSSTTEFYS